jgi:5-methylcytosine-specific restriction protein A
VKLQQLRTQLRPAASKVIMLPTQRPETVERTRGSAGVRDRDRIRARDCGLCQECKRNGRTTLGGPVDHIRPLWKGGSDDDINKEVLCVPCHDAKTAREAKQRAGAYG